MQIRLLGPVEVSAAGQRLDTGPPQRRAVLAALAVDAGRPVPVATLVQRVWGEDAPDHARPALQAHITHLRQVLHRAASTDSASTDSASTDAAGSDSASTDAARSVAPVDVGLVHGAGGYLLRLDPGQVDVLRFRQLAARAREAEQTDEGRLHLLRQALDLWRGVPLGDLRGDWPERTRETWRLERLDAAVGWARVELRLGHHDEVIGRVRPLLADHPLAEPLAAALIGALCAVGRAAEALDCYAMVRARLADQLGVDPGAELQELHQAALRGQLGPAEPDARAVTVRIREAPAQLPPGVSGFAGRRAELARLDLLLAQAPARPTEAVIVVVSGTAGVGKTALAVHWAHRVADRFPDGQIYLDLSGFASAATGLSPAEAVRTLLDAFGVPAQRVPDGLAAQVGLYRSLLAGRRVLVVLDNARDADQVRWLLPGAPGCFALVTSRDQLTGLVATEAAHPLRVDLLSMEEARTLLAYRLGAHCVAAQPAPVDEIIRRCARLPLALAVVAGRAATRPDFPLAGLAGELRAAGGGLDIFDETDAGCDVRTVFSWSYRALTPVAADLFRVLGLHPGPDFAVPAAASLVGRPLPQVQPALAELTRAHLVARPSPDRYALHDLLRAYATELAGGHQENGVPAGSATASEPAGAVRRLLDHYLHSAHLAARLLNPHRDAVTPAAAAAGVTMARPDGHDHALAWFRQEHQVLIAAVRLATDAGLDAHVWQLGWALTTILQRRGRWHELVEVQCAALEAGERLGDPCAQAHAHRDLAGAYAKLDRRVAAERHHRHALALFGQLGDRAGEAHTHVNVSFLLERQGRYGDALDHAQRALELYAASGHPAGQARSLNAVGWYHARLGNHRLALLQSRQALGLFRTVGDPRGEADAWDSLGYAHQCLGHHRVAEACYHHALERYRTAGDLYKRADTLTRLGDTYRSGGRPEAAHHAWRQALQILDRLGHPDAARVRARLYGQA